MKKIDLGQTITILANIGVIAGIIFLALELNQNNQLLEVEALDSALESRIATAELYLDNQNLLELDAKIQSEAPLTDVEIRTVFRLNVRNHLGWQKEFFLWQADVIDDALFRSNMQGLLQGPALLDLEFWETWKVFAAPDYREFIERCVISECAELPR